MTVVSLVSVKGAPGVTTTACLVAAAWPTDRRGILVENDHSGGDLAPRFRLSEKRGWSSYVASSRRLNGIEPIEDHLQRLPGGVEVLAAPPGHAALDERPAIEALLASFEAGSATSSTSPDRSTPDRSTSVDLIVDLGRLLPVASGVETWLERSTVVVIVARRDAASLFHLRERQVSLRRQCRGRFGLVIVGSGSPNREEIERFTTLPVLGELPHDPNAGRIAGGCPGGTRRLSRSRLVLDAQRLALTLSGVDQPVASRPDRAPECGEPEPGIDATGQARVRSRWSGWSFRGRWRASSNHPRRAKDRLAARRATEVGGSPGGKDRRHLPETSNPHCWVRESSEERWSDEQPRGRTVKEG